MILSKNESNTLPEIIYDELEGKISIKGRSISTEVHAHFREFLNYFKEFVEKDPTNLKVQIDLEYFNTTTSKALMNFLNLIKDHIIKKGKDAKINWYIESDDEDMFETVFDFQASSGVEINVIEK